MRGIILFLGILLIFSTQEVRSNNNQNNNQTMKFELVKLPYAADALEPAISKATIELHHGKHLQAYVNNLNNLIAGTDFENKSLIEIVKTSDGGIFNNGGQVLNHELYFLSFSPKGGGEPTGKLAEAIKAQWGSFDEFKKDFVAQAVGLFGSGWLWLAKDDAGKLSVVKEQNAGNPVTKGLTPILGFDVWEHSYYVDYQNRRADHLNELWKIIDWEVVGKRY